MTDVDQAVRDRWCGEEISEALRFMNDDPHWSFQRIERRCPERVGMNLLPISQFPALPGVSVPDGFYWLLREPAPLAGMAMPRPGTPWRAIYEAGFRHVVNLAEATPSYDPAPLLALCSVELEDLWHRQPPRDPRREHALISQAVERIAASLLSRHGVVVHCLGGTGRTGTVIGCTLRRLGVSAPEVCAHLIRLNEARKRHWPESDWQAEVVSAWDTGTNAGDAKGQGG
jgi:hypothetical protein